VGDWYDVDEGENRYSDWDYWLVRAFTDKEKAYDLAHTLNVLVMGYKDWEKAYEYDEHLDREYVQRGIVEYKIENCELD
jgi:hypothetical protein